MRFFYSYIPATFFYITFFRKEIRKETPTFFPPEITQSHTDSLSEGARKNNKCVFSHIVTRIRLNQSGAVLNPRVYTCLWKKFLHVRCRSIKVRCYFREFKCICKHSSQIQLLRLFFYQHFSIYTLFS